MAGPTDNPTPEARQRYRKGSLDSRVTGLLGNRGPFRERLRDAVYLRDRAQSGASYALNDDKVGIRPMPPGPSRRGAWI